MAYGAWLSTLNSGCHRWQLHAVQPRANACKEALPKISDNKVRDYSYK